MLPRIVIATQVGGRDLPFQRVCEKLAKNGWNYTVSFVLGTTTPELRIFDVDGKFIDAYIDRDIDDFGWIESVYMTQIQFAQEELIEKASLLRRLVAYSKGGSLTLSDDHLQILARERKTLLADSVREALNKWFSFMEPYVASVLDVSMSDLETWPYDYDEWLAGLDEFVGMTKRVISKALDRENAHI